VSFALIFASLTTSLSTDAGKMSQGKDPTAGQMYSGNMPDDMEGSDLLALFVLDDIPNEVRTLQIAMQEINIDTTTR
jgi:hypothetical protein